MKALIQQSKNDRNLLLQIHEKISSFTAHLIGPFVFNFGPKEEPWNLRTADLLSFPDGSVGKALGDFLSKSRLEPISGAESHDLYHLLFGFSTSFKDEVGLQFFLRGNGKRSIASCATSIGAWCIFIGQWHYLKSAYARGRRCIDVSTLNPRALLTKNFEEVCLSLFQDSASQMDTRKNLKKESFVNNQNVKS